MGSSAKPPLQCAFLLKFSCENGCSHYFHNLHAETLNNVSNVSLIYEAYMSHQEYLIKKVPLSVALRMCI